MIRRIYQTLGATGQYAISEAERFCKILDTSMSGGQDLILDVEIDSTLEASIYVEKKGMEISFKAIDESSLLHAVYLFAERLGYIFDFSGESVPETVDPLLGQDFKIQCTPGVKNRGIRMHLNFVQDQSFFTEEEFAKSIDHMAQLKFNYLVFHMYNPQEWYPFSYRGKEHLDLSLGNLERAHLDEHMIGRDKIKVKDHWFPADLEEIQDIQILKMAMYQRYKRLMAHAKARGIRVGVSIEPESLSETFTEELKNWSFVGDGAGDALVNHWQQGWSGKSLADVDIKNPVVYDIAVARCCALLEAFPDMDELHLISREGTSYRLPQEEYHGEFSRIKQRFSLPDSMLDLNILGEIIPESEDEIEVQAKIHQYWTVLPGDNHLATVCGALRFVEFAIDIFDAPPLKELMVARNVQTCVTVYSPNPATISHISPAIAQMMPKDCHIHYLADYGAKEIGEHLDNWQPLLNQKLSVGMISWLEFDGCMMLAQDWSHALHESIQKAHGMGMETMYFNHWRVRSLEQAAQVASCSTFSPTTSFDNLIGKYWEKLYGKTAQSYVAPAFQALEEATIYSKRYNFNIGFTNNWVFYHSTEAPGYHWHLLKKSAQNYRQAMAAFDFLAQRAESYGKRQAEYMRDLCGISAKHVEAVYYLQQAKLPLWGFGAWPIDNKKACWPAPELLTILESYAGKALDLEEEYMQTYAYWVKSCDEQGQLAMHHQGVIQPFRHFFQTLLHKRQEGEKFEAAIFD